MNITKKIGLLLTGIWLILMGAASFVPFIADLGVVLSLLAIVAGVFVILDR